MSTTGTSTTTPFRSDELVRFTKVGIMAGLTKQLLRKYRLPVLSYAAHIRGQTIKQLIKITLFNSLYTMSIEELKRIPIVELLAHLGHEPAYRTGGGKQWVYHSPLRKDSTPSFFVTISKNLWVDFGSSEGGNVIDLAVAIKGGCSFHEAVLWLEEQYGGFRDMSPIDYSSFDDSDGSLSIVKTLPLNHPTLLNYLSSRGIPREIAVKYCREIHYSIRGREYYSVGFPNIVGGYELRNPFFKGCHGEKPPSIIPLSKSGRTECCCIFEGFMDFLSYQTLVQSGNTDVVQPFPCDSIVLNSTSMARKTVPFVDVYRRAFCYLDNDDAGRKAFAQMEESLPGKLVNRSGIDWLAPYKDLNDYLILRK